MAQSRLDSLKSLTVEKFKEPEISLHGLKEFELNIKPMKLIEPEIYLFGPADLVPDHQFDFSPESHYFFSLSGDHISSVDQIFSVVQPGKSVWWKSDENYSRQNFRSTSLESGKVSFSLGNSQTKNSEILFSFGGNAEGKKISPWKTSDSLFHDNKSVFSIESVLKNNPLLFSDEWLIKAKYFDYNVENSSGEFFGEWNKDLTILKWNSSAEFIYFSDQLIKIKSGLEYNSDFWNAKINAGFQHLKNEENSGGKNESEVFSELSLNLHQRFFHHQIRIDVNEIEFTPTGYFESPFWFINQNSISSSGINEKLNVFNSITKNYFSAAYLLDWIPNSNWVFSFSPSTESKDVLQFAAYNSVTKERINFLNISTKVKYAGETIQWSASHLWNRTFSPEWKNFTVPYLAEHEFDFRAMFGNQNENNCLLLGGNYLLKRKVFRDQYDFKSSVFSDFSEIYCKIEDFHARPVKFFGEIKLYLNGNHYYPGQVSEKYFYKAGIALQF